MGNDCPLLENRVLFAGASPTAGEIANDSPAEDTIANSALEENDNAETVAEPTLDNDGDGQREEEASGAVVAEDESPARELTVIAPEDRVANLRGARTFRACRGRSFEANR